MKPYISNDGSDLSASAARVLSHYQLVDEGELDAVIDLYAPDTVYRRPGYEPFRGRDAVAEFYLRLRQIQTSSHRITAVVAEGENVAVQGEFRGTGVRGEPIDLRFSDFFVIGPDGYFTARDTFYFAAI
jgi:steroid delta-isomerase